MHSQALRNWCKAANLLQVLEHFRQGRKEIEISKVSKHSRTDSSSRITWNGKLNEPSEEKAQLRTDELKLKLIWRSEDGNRNVQNSPK